MALLAADWLIAQGALIVSCPAREGRARVLLFHFGALVATCAVAALLLRPRRRLTAFPRLGQRGLWLAGLVLAAGCSKRCGAPVDAADCGPEIAHLDLLRDAPLILLGEMHGLTAPPAFAVDLACRLAAAGSEVQLAVEIPRGEQPRIDAFLASAGAAADRAALLAGAFWRREQQDGRSSEARVEMLQVARRLRSKGLPLRIAAIDQDEPYTPARDASMAEALLAARRAGERTVLLIGNYHARTEPGAPWDPKVIWSGVKLREKEPRLVALDNRYAAGDAWVCFQGAPCGINRIAGRGQAGSFGIVRFAAPDEHGFDGLFDVGLAVASRPAVQGR